MLGSLLAGLSGFTQSVSDVIGKKLANENRWRVLATSTGITAVIALIITAIIGIPEVPVVFWIIIVVATPLEILGAYAFLRAIQSGELSLTAPLLNLTPALVLLITWALAIEPLTTVGTVGVLLIVAGGFLLMSSSPLGAIKAVHQPSGQWALLAAVVWSITSTIGKQAVLRGGVVFTLAILLSLVSVLCWIFYFSTRTKTSKQNKTSQGTKIILKGMTDAVMYGLQNTAYLFAPAAQVIALKKTSTLWSLLWGKIVFKETFGIHRVLAALVMFSGVLCIVFG
jgi:drug/metabolite transporter (DMT)-like permease